ncbi:MAG: polysaccharide biosynthesis protein, partial [Acidimicrobiia bacterium]
AGDAGSAILKDILANPSLAFDPVGILDDDQRTHGRKLHGVSIVGDRHQLPELVAALDVDQVLFTVPSATSDVVRDVASLCERAGVTLKVLPSIHEVVGGRVSARDIRDLSIEDLLGRQQVETDLEAVGSILRGQRVLITGAGGSIGSEIARQVSGFEPASMILLDHDETLLHDVSTDLPQARVILADIRDRARIFERLGRERPEVVFHAAAHKHVPLLEDHPEEALITNVIGTLNVAEAAMASGARRFVLISTDKAVRPVSVMGASKRLAEQAVRAIQTTDCLVCTVRFGNVLGSRGSVIPTFLRQIAHGGPVTVTHPEMTRYFMSVHEAVQLVLQASALATGGEVFTLDMGEPVNILDLARKVIRLSGRLPDTEIPLQIVGPRPGEKLFEDLVDEGENPVSTAHSGIVVSRPSLPDGDRLLESLRALERAIQKGQATDLGERLRDLAGGTDASLDSELARTELKTTTTVPLEPGL